MDGQNDQILTGCIMDSLDSTKGQDYVYCISVQGHGDYPTITDHRESGDHG